MKLSELPYEKQIEIGKKHHFFKLGIKQWLSMMSNAEVDGDNDNSVPNDDEVDKAPCSHCGELIEINDEIPNHICRDCEMQVTDKNGQAIAFYNDTFSGGLVGYYYDEYEGALHHKPYTSNECYLGNKIYYAYEGRFGGVFISPDKLDFDD